MGSTETREKFLDAGEALLLADGYQRTSVETVCERAGMTKGSLYHHFKTKEDLAIAILERWLFRNAAILSNGPHANESDPVDAALSYMDHVVASSGQLWTHGCLVGSLSMDLASSSDRMQHCVENMFQTFVSQHAQLFAPLLDQSPLEEKPSSEELAEFFLSTIEGSIVLSKSYQNHDPLVRALRSFSAYLRHLAGRSLAPS